jgi:hypothetical protein
LYRSYLEIESVSDVLYNWKHVTAEWASFSVS